MEQHNGYPQVDSTTAERGTAGSWKTELVEVEMAPSVKVIGSGADRDSEELKSESDVQTSRHDRGVSGEIPISSRIVDFEKSPAVPIIKRERPDQPEADNSGAPLKKKSAIGVSALTSGGGGKKSGKSSSDSHRNYDNEVIRTGTVRRIMKIDKDVKMTGLEAVNLVSKATEFFLSWLADVCLKRTSDDGRKTIRYHDVVMAAEEVPQFEFLKDLLSCAEKIKAKEKEARQNLKTETKDSRGNV